ncbi:MAG: methyltransferase domain-containing protein [Chthoniobacter sp.]|uniref:class I SAM-dependent methyltransferase n=1 Tax=Chthoniobacter sp. TaxID=2510640 RepID=UPI0032A75615
MSEDPSSWQNPDFVAKFLENVRGAIPLTIEQIEVMLQLITVARGERIGTFLDLGCGEGVLADAILAEHPEAHGVLVDFSEPMLEGARQHLKAHSHRLEFLEADFAQPAWVRRVAPHAPLDVVVSGFAIHHLPDARKQALYREIFDLLTPEGIFINIEHVASAIRWTESKLDDYMIDAIFGKELKSSPRKSRAAVARDYYARADQDANILAPLEVQCDWLRDIGFENVDCFLKMAELAVFGGQRPAE